MNNFDYNLSPTSLRSPSRFSRKNNSSTTIDRSRAAHSAMSSNPTPANRQSPRSSRQAPPSLSNLPRFHPANFANYANSNTSSSASSTLTSPESQTTSPSIAPLSPRTSRQTSQLSEAQRQLYIYHRELYGINRSGSGANSPGAPGFTSYRPVSPNLQPLASPGAVTPLELEEADQSDGYLMAGTRSHHSANSSLNVDVPKDQILDTYIRRETQAARRTDGEGGNPQ